MARRKQFKESAELKRVFNRHLENWKKRYRSTLEDLALRCGVTASYLGHVGRYGRIPGAPVLILLTLNFELEDANELFSAAGLNGQWPYEGGIKLMSSDAALPSFFRLDMLGFAKAIREIVRAETRPRLIRDITQGRSLRVGFNLHKTLWFDRKGAASGGEYAGFFPELFRMLSLTLQSRSEVSDVHFAAAIDLLDKSALDLYGPIYSTLPRFSRALHTHPICRVALVALGRKRKAANLKALKHPAKLDDLRNEEYKIAVLKDSMGHHFCLSHLSRSQADLILCDTPDETLERVTLGGLGRAAHVMLCDGPIAIAAHRAQPDDYELLFAEKGRALTYFEETVMIRPDWPDMVAFLNETIDFLKRSGTLESLLQRWVPQEYHGVVQVA